MATTSVEDEMAVTESQRQRLFRKVEEVFGPEEAATFMEVVLPGSWNDVATKRDLDELRRWTEERFERVEGRFDARFERVDERFERVDERFERVDARFEQIDARFAGVDDRFTGIEERLVGTETRINARIDERVTIAEDRVNARMDHRFDLVEHRLATIEATMVDKAMLHRELRMLFGTILTANVAVGGLVLAVAQAV
jgi:hypothetical protein